ncbi:MAG: serine hydrolase, partial [Oscillospiraceae bacterium]|nr:serine hydrolase [Oscillospiraceae bacterium]
DELDALMAPFIEKYGLTERNFGLGFLYTGSNESYYINGDSAKYAASVFKVPLCMLVAEKVSSGELQQEDTFAELAISTIEERCIIASNNTIAYSVYSALQPDTPELLTKYSGVEAESLPTEYRRQYYTPRMIVNTLHTLYEDPERFPNIIECMLQAQPNNYFRQTLEGRWDVAQKYGQYASVLNNAGIIYTPTPIILVVMTDRLHGNMELIGELAEVFSEYALTLDERAAEREEAQLAQEEAARRAEDEARRAAETERQRLEAEKAAQAEAERLAAEAAARAEAEQLAAARLESRARRLRIAAVSGTGLLPALGFMLYRKRK